MADQDFGKDFQDESNGLLVYETKFKGRPVLVIKNSTEDKYPVISMGMTKCKAILENYEAIEAFVKKHEK